MRELERDLPSPSAHREKLAVIGRGRLGSALTRALREADWPVSGPWGRDWTPDSLAGAGAILLCVPDRALGALSAALPGGTLVGHCSGASTLAPLAPHEAFALHPLMTVPERGASFAGAGAAVAGATERATGLARSIARALGMIPFGVADGDRPLYHAAASVASNFLVTLEAVAGRLFEEIGLEPRLLAPLARATVENVASTGARSALTGPVARGDDATVAAQREAIADRAPDLLALFDSLVQATRDLAASPAPAGAAAA